MIRYALTCEKGHGFESWFPDSASFDAQVKRRLVSCPVCGSVKIEKAIMSPNITRKTRETVFESTEFVENTSVPASVPAPVPAQPVVLLTDEAVALRAMLRAFRKHVTENADNVGKGFAEEALKIHHGEIDHRAIYGEATPDDARMLEEEGVAFSPLPVLPEEHN
jgi:hypothetical protein